MHITLRTAHLLFLILVSLLVVYMLVAFILFREQVFLDREHLSISEIGIAAGAGLLLISIPLSLIWLNAAHARENLKPSYRFSFTAIGIMALICLPVAKVMVDEIAKELPARMNTKGEWVILYGCLFLLLFFHAGVAVQLAKKTMRRSQRGSAW